MWKRPMINMIGNILFGLVTEQKLRRPLNFVKQFVILLEGAIEMLHCGQRCCSALQCS